MIRLYMNVMLSIWKQIVQHASKKKKPPVVLSGYSKNQDLTMFFVRIGRVFFRILNSVFFGLGFWTRPLVSLRIGSVISIGLDISNVERPDFR
jgi:hypothetical protein